MLSLGSFPSQAGAVWRVEDLGFTTESSLLLSKIKLYISVALLCVNLFGERSRADFNISSWVACNNGGACGNFDSSMQQGCALNN